MTYDGFGATSTVVYNALMEDAAGDSRQATTDREHLRLLAIFFYVVGSIMMLFSCLPIIHVVIGILMLINPAIFDGPNPPPPGMRVMIGVMFAAIGGLFVLTGWAVGILMMYTGRCIQNRRRRVFTIVMAAISCAFFPFGMVLGVCTIIVLNRESVMRLYEAQSALVDSKAAL